MMYAYHGAVPNYNKVSRRDSTPAPAYEANGYIEAKSKDEALTKLVERG